VFNKCGGARMSKYLVIVESPAKAKTIEKFLGRNYKVKASIGHIRDLPKSKMGIAIDEDFEPQYINIRGKGTLIKELKKEAKKAEKIFLATDPDREGEAISWHLAHILGIDYDTSCRIEFNEVTKDAVKQAIKNPRKIDVKLVDAQQARRVLDRLVGYSISPLLWRKVRKGLSAGRVQSVANKIICTKENEINAFNPEEYWTINADIYKGSKKNKINAELASKAGKKIKINNEEESKAIEKELIKGKFFVGKVTKKVKKRSPGNCFTTSSLQQEASNRFGFSTKKTMIIAQQLYEGIKLKGAGTVGLITYMRTDSTRISNEAKEALKEFILEKHGKEYFSETERKTSSKKNAQDAHEAIRPTYVVQTPYEINESLTKDQFKLYSLIWERFVASQMSDAKFDSVSVEINNGDYTFKVNGSLLKFDGFLKVYKHTTYKEQQLPELEVGDAFDVISINPEQHFTQPPARYTEASLVKEMEEKGIGRPSTYAPTISTILSRGYVEKEKKSLKPTELGFIIYEIMENYFDEIVAVDFTVNLEEKFDKIEEGNVEWKEPIREFYSPFIQMIEKAEEELEKLDFTEQTEEICPKCGNFLNRKHGRYGKFLACSNYPECKYTKAELNSIGIKCPKCEKGEVVERKTKKLKNFYGCSEFPNCDFVSWKKPVAKPCPECGSVLVENITKKKKEIKCSNKECKYSEELE
jgi:DNA topoisomerase-1